MAIRREGGSESGVPLKLNWKLNSGSARRIGAVVPKACGNAVMRNQIKRWLREAWREMQADLPAGLDSVWIARPSAQRAGWKKIRSEMIKLYRQARLLAPAKT